MGCILYISAFWQEEPHLHSQCRHANLAFVFAKLPSTVSVLCMWHLRREKLTLEAASNTHIRPWETLQLPGRAQLFQRHSLSQPGTLEGLYERVETSCCWRTAWPKVFGWRVTPLCALSTFLGCLLGPFPVPPASIPLGVKSVLCTAALPGTWHERRVTCEEGWIRRALVNHLKYTSFFRL